MLKTELAPGITHYIFPPRDAQDHYGDSIIAVVHNSKAILIDTAFEDEMQQVIDDLSAQGVEIINVIISHFHDDHMEGLKLLTGVEVYGSYRFQETLDMWTAKDEHKFYTPTFLVEIPVTIEFGSHTLEITPWVGHSLCSVLVKINEQFIHVADEIMYAHDGQPLLPSIESRSVIPRQLDAWNKLEKYHNFTIIPGHGAAFDGSKLCHDLKNRQEFAKAILAAVGTLTYEEAVQNCDCTFVQKDWFNHLAE